MTEETTREAINRHLRTGLVLADEELEHLYAQADAFRAMIAMLGRHNRELRSHLDAALPLVVEELVAEQRLAREGNDAAAAHATILLGRLAGIKEALGPDTCERCHAAHRGLDRFEVKDRKRWLCAPCANQEGLRG